MRRVMIVTIAVAVAALAVLAFYRLRRDVTLQPVPTEQSIDQLLERVRVASQRARALRADFEFVDTDGATEQQKYRGRIRLLKPNFAFMETTSGSFLDYLIVASDGKAIYTVIKDSKTYKRRGAPPGRVPFWGERSPVACFYDIDEAMARGKRQLTGTEFMDGQEYATFETAYSDPPWRVKCYVGASGLIERTVESLNVEGRHMVNDLWLKNVDTDTSMRAEDFAYNVPEGYRLVEPRAAAEEKLLTVGSTAPDFKLPRPDSSFVQLEDVLKRQKVVLLNFWFCDCAPCRSELPLLEKLHRKLRGRGLEIIAVNTVDSAARIRKCVKDDGLTFEIVVGGAEDAKAVKAYKVESCPTNILIGADRRVLWRGVGFDEAALRQALAAAGFE